MDLASFKKALVVGTKVRIVNHLNRILSRNSFVSSLRTNGVCFDYYGQSLPFDFPTNAMYEEIDDRTCNIYVHSFYREGNKKLALTITL